MPAEPGRMTRSRAQWRRMLDLAKRALGSLLICQASIALPATPKEHPGLSQRPVVTVPACSAPRPYHVDRWTPKSNRFYISLASKSRIEDADREAGRLAKQHNFEIDGSGLRSGGGYFFVVSWLEPAQVAALRCEDAIEEIDIGEEVQITSTGRY